MSKGYSKRNKAIMTIIQIICIIIVIYCLVVIIRKNMMYKQDTNVYNEIRKEYNEENNNASVSAYNRLKDVNSDFVFWIRVEGTNIDYPVVQGKDNNFYLKKDFNKKESISGCIFVNCDNDIETDQNVIIYGHNMRNDSMFNQLQKFKDKKFFDKDNKVIITDKDGESTYEVYGVYVLAKGEKLGEINYEDDEALNDDINKLKEKAIFLKDMKHSINDKMITLVTCTYEIDDGRTIILAKKIK